MVTLAIKNIDIHEKLAKQSQANFEIREIIIKYIQTSKSRTHWSRSKHGGDLHRPPNKERYKKPILQVKTSSITTIMWINTLDPPTLGRNAIGRVTC